MCSIWQPHFEYSEDQGEAAETMAAQAGWDHFGLEVPMLNHHAMDYLLARCYRLDAFVTTLMSDRPFDGLDRYILTSPPFFL